MCFDVQSSLLAWSLTYSISLYLFYRNQNYDRWNAGFIMTFSTIQLLEAGIWVALDDKNQWMNDLLTRLVLLALLLQPLVQNYMGYKFTGNGALGILSFVFLGVLVWTMLRVWRSTPNQFQSSVGPKGHLMWSDEKSSSLLGGFAIGTIYVAGLFIPLFVMKDWKGLPLIIVGAITALYSLLVAPRKEFASYWCYTSVAYAIAALFV